MQSQSCESCSALQPASWCAGDLCHACGGAVRCEVRCVSCLVRTPAGFCRTCGTQTVADADFGVARMLLAGGVDRFSLSRRLQELDAGQKETLASRYAAQWAWVLARVDEVRACETHLVFSHWHDQCAQRWLAHLPFAAGAQRTANPGPFGDRDLISFERSNDYDVSVLASIALLHVGAVNRDRVRVVLRVLDNDTELAIEALAALVRPGCWQTLRSLLYGRASNFAQRITALAQREPSVDVRARAAVRTVFVIAEALVTRVFHNEALSAEHDDVLRQVLHHVDPQLQFAAAVLVSDPATLREALTTRFDGEEDDAHHARLCFAVDALARSDAVWLSQTLPKLPAHLRKNAIDALDEAGGEVLDTMLRSAPLLDAEARAQLLHKTFRRFFALDGSARELLSNWWRAYAEALVDDVQAWDALDAVAQALHAPLGSCPPLLSPFVSRVALACTNARTAGDATTRELVQHRLLRTFIAHASLAQLDVLAPLLEDDDHARVIVAALLSTQLSRGSDAGDAAELTPALVHWWSRHQGTPAFVRAVSRATASNSGNSAMDGMKAWWRSRYLSHRDERRALWLAFDGWRSTFENWRDEQPVGSALRPTSAVEWFALYAQLDTEHAALWDVTTAARQHADVYDPAGRPALLEAVFDKAMPLVLSHPRQALASCFCVVCGVADPYCDDPLDADHTVAADRLRVRVTALLHVVDAGPWPLAANDPDANHFVDDIRVRLRLMDEALLRARPEPEPEPARDCEPEPSPMLRTIETQTATPTVVAAASHSVPSTVHAGHRWRFCGDTLPMDAVVCVPDSALPTLLDYVGLLVAMQRGADVLALFEAHAITPAQWGACASAWGQQLTQNPQMAMRMAMLLQGTWESLD